MYKFLLLKVLAAYGIKYQKIFDYQKGYRNEIWPVLLKDGHIINITFYKREVGIAERIRRADSVSEFLADSGMYTRRRYDKRILTISNSKSTVYVGVYDYLKGVTIPWESYTMERIKSLGGTMGIMHSNLAKMHMAGFYSVYEEYLNIIDRMKAYFSDNSVKTAVYGKLKIKISKDKLDQYSDILNQLSLLPGQQILHMDFVRGNVLFNEDEVAGVLDFEKTAVGHTVMDIARTLAFLLVDCKYKKPDKIVKYFLLSGYIKRGKNMDIGNNETRACLMEMFLLYDFYKFLRHNPYEYLYMNEHYIRTRDILAKRGVILYKK